MKDHIKAHLAVLGTTLFFSINFSVVKILIDGGLIQSFGLNLVRMIVTVVLLWILFAFKKETSTFKKEDYPRLILCSITGIVFNQLIFVKGLSLTTPIHASLLMMATPILIMFSAAWILKEKLSNNKLTGLVFAIAGALILVLTKKQSTYAANTFLGDLFVLLNAISYTIYFILVKPLMNRYSPLMIIRMLFTIGLFLALPFCTTQFIQIPWNQYSVTDFGLLSLVAIGGTFLAYTLNIYAINIIGASKTGSYIYLQPFLATVIAVILGKDIVEPYKILAAAFIFLGLYLINKFSK
jgi:drug/metabolite transporter (DMT)-like permease